MHSIEQAIEQAVGVILFAVAVVLLLSGARRIDALSESLRQQRIEDNDIAFETSQQEIFTEPDISYAQLVATLSERIEYDIYVDDVLITAATYSPSQLSAYPIPVHAAYKRETHYNPDGTVEYVVYRGI